MQCDGLWLFRASHKTHRQNFSIVWLWMCVCVCVCVCVSARAFCLDTSIKFLSKEIKLKLHVRKFCYSIIFQKHNKCYTNVDDAGRFRSWRKRKTGTSELKTHKWKKHCLRITDTILHNVYVKYIYMFSRMASFSPFFKNNFNNFETWLRQVA